MRMLFALMILCASLGPALAAEKLTVLLDWFVNPDHAPLIVAKEKGYFADAGLEVELIPPADPSAPPRLVAAGEGDIAISYQPNLYLQAEAKLPAGPLRHAGRDTAQLAGRSGRWQRQDHRRSERQDGGLFRRRF
jgi:ABC-type nitrate/sulfonate/bicarbonate transport system substrate-binding protein